MLKKTLFIPSLVIIGGIVMSAFSSWSVYRSEQSSIMNEFRHDVDVRVSSLYREIIINFEALRSLSILFTQESTPEKSQFTKQAKNILARHDDIQALEWIPKVNSSNRSTYELAQQQDFPGFEFIERKSQGEMVTAKERDEYYPVYFVEPVIGNEAAVGFDLASSAARLKTLEASRDSGIPLATASITLVQDRDKQKGFLAFLPIYKQLSITKKTREKNIKGFVLGVYSIKDIFISSSLTDTPLGITMTLIDETSADKEDILYQHNIRANSELYTQIRYKKTLPELWGRKWSVVASPTLNYMSMRSTALPSVIAIMGIVFSFGIALYIYILANRANTIKRLVAEQTQELTEANQKLAQISRTDGLTGVANRGYLNEILEKEWMLAIRHQTPLSFILIDIDFFKPYNDTYGHPEGDICLKRVAKKLNSMIKRPTDLVARYGGEEFAIVLPNTEDASSVAERCRKVIYDLQIPHENSPVADVVTISLGTCTLIPPQSSDASSIVDAADKALYKSKEKGRNRVTSHNFSSKLSEVKQHI